MEEAEDVTKDVGVPQILIDPPQLHGIRRPANVRRSITGADKTIQELSESLILCNLWRVCANLGTMVVYVELTLHGPSQ